MTEKHFGLYFLLLFKISDFILFFMQQLRSLPPPAQKSHPLFSSNLPLKIEILPDLVFKNLVGDSIPQEKGMHTM